MFTRRNFVLFILFLFGSFMIPFNILKRKKKCIICLMPGYSFDMYVDHNCTYRQAVIEYFKYSKRTVSRKIGSILVSNNNIHKDIFRSEGSGIKVEEIYNIDIPKLDWIVNDNDHILIVGGIYGDGIPTFKDLKENRTSGSVALIRKRNGEFQEIWIDEKHVIKSEPGRYVHVSDFRMFSGLGTLEYLCRKHHKKFSVPDDYKYPNVIISKKDFNLLPGWRRKLFL